MGVWYLFYLIYHSWAETDALFDSISHTKGQNNMDLCSSVLLKKWSLPIEWPVDYKPSFNLESNDPRDSDLFLATVLRSIGFLSVSPVAIQTC